MLVRKLHADAKLPRRANDCAAGFDLCVLTHSGGDVALAPGDVGKFHTGLAIELPPGTFGDIRPRSGNFSRGLMTSGTIDEDYRGEVFVVIANVSREPQVVKNGTRVAQLVVTPYLAPSVFESEELSDTERGAKGFGSTGE